LIAGIQASYGGPRGPLDAYVELAFSGYTAQRLAPAPPAGDVTPFQSLLGQLSF